MEPLHALNVKPTTQYVYTGDESDLRKTGCIQKGKLGVTSTPKIMTDNQ